ncbi:MAG: hypothetical protein M3381_08735, partial [Actinomycetota bacterium]|nr:hypothetical protein [Actinomycetota bacterium]
GHFFGLQHREPPRRRADNTPFAGKADKLEQPHDRNIMDLNLDRDGMNTGKDPTTDFDLIQVYAVHRIPGEGEN